MSLRQAQAEITSREFSEWLAFDRLEPIGSEPEDYRAALIAHTVYSVLRSEKQPALAIDDFLLEVRKVTADEAAEKQAERMAAALGVKRRQAPEEA